MNVGRERVEDSSVMRVVVGTFHRLGSHYFRSERVLHPEHMLEKKTQHERVCQPWSVHESNMPCTLPSCPDQRRNEAPEPGVFACSEPVVTHRDALEFHFASIWTIISCSSRQLCAQDWEHENGPPSVCGHLDVRRLSAVLLADCLCHLPDPKRAPND